MQVEPSRRRMFRTSSPGCGCAALMLGRQSAEALRFMPPPLAAASGGSPNSGTDCCCNGCAALLMPGFARLCSCMSPRACCCSCCQGLPSNKPPATFGPVKSEAMQIQMDMHIPHNTQPYMSTRLLMESIFTAKLP